MKSVIITVQENCNEACHLYLSLYVLGPTEIVIVRKLSTKTYGRILTEILL
jgi:hypothetical protein